jgi:hypothetical protein
MPSDILGRGDQRRVAIEEACRVKATCRIEHRLINTQPLGQFHDRGRRHQKSRRHWPQVRPQGFNRQPPAHATRCVRHDVPACRHHTLELVVLPAHQRHVDDVLRW